MNSRQPKQGPNLSVIGALSFVLATGFWTCLNSSGGLNQGSSSESALTIGCWIFSAILLPLIIWQLNHHKSNKLKFAIVLLMGIEVLCLAKLRTYRASNQLQYQQQCIAIEGEVRDVRWDHDQQWRGTIKTPLAELFFSAQERPKLGPVSALGNFYATSTGFFVQDLITLPTKQPSPINKIGWLSKFRQALRDRLDVVLDPAEAGLARALVLGERDTVPLERYDHYRALGLLHLLAVSGMHLWCLDLLLKKLLLFLPKKLRWIRLLALAVAALAAGFRPAVVRAFSVICLRDMIRATGRNCSSFNLWAMALWCECLLIPPRLGDLGLVLSYSATAGLLWANRPKAALLTSNQQQRSNVFSTIWKASLAASLATAPWLHALQGSIEPWSVLLTPFLGLLLPFRLILSWLAAIPKFSSGLLGEFQDFCCKLISACLNNLGAIENWLLIKLDGLAGSPLFIPEVEWWRLASFSWLALLLLGLNKAQVKLIVVLVMLPLAWGLIFPPVSSAGVAMLPVGHGLAVIVAGPKESLLFDFGSRHIPPTTLIRKKLLPVLARKRWRMPQSLVASHGDSDHLSGLAQLEQIGASAFIGAPVGGSLALTGLTPIEGKIFNAPVSADAHGNAGGQALELNWNNERLIVTGDQEGPALRWLAKKIEATPAGSGKSMHTTLVLPHHGLSSDGLPELLDASNADVTWASCSFADRPLPARPLVEKRQLPLFTTAQNGVLFWPKHCVSKD